MAESQEQRDFIIKPLRELATKLYPYVGEKHVYLLTHLLELDRRSIEQSKCPLLAFMEDAEETGRIASNNVIA
ncbi:hypothetical protein HOLleu_16014 [Holothuria leucospilota]|uniref:Uncharacterized protein n=1 Tax=Holothuria leucospilota TaxID=206669 RepID=A0A9Q1C5J6_HOLLE|nr:hypothetical protein HOLleu_16014 [Holothuria leucospilota]